MKRVFVSGLVGLIGLLLGVSVQAVAAPVASADQPPAARSLAEGAGMGARPDGAVRRLQRLLEARGSSLGPSGVDGRFGPRTAAAVRDLQSSFGLEPDGVVGPKTRKLLRVLCSGSDCVRKEGKRVSDRRPAGTVPPPPTAAPDTAPDDSLSPAAPTVVAFLALLVLALGYGWWRSERSSPTEAPDPESGEPEGFSPRVLGYLGESGSSSTANPPGADTEAQEAEIEAECMRRGWELVEVLSEVPGGREREALVYALERIGAGDASCLMVGRLERVGGSASELARLLEWLDKACASLVVLDVGIDTTSREGALAADVLVAVTKAERRRTLVRASNGWRAHAPGSDA